MELQERSIAVLIPYQQAEIELLQRAIRSVANAHISTVLSYQDDIVSEWLQSPRQFVDGHLDYYPAQRVGVVGARNAMINSHLGELYIPLDADDELIPGAKEALTNAWEPGTWVYGGWIEAEPDGTETVISAPPPGMLNRKALCHATMLFHRNDWAKVGGYDPDFNLGGEDWAFQVALTAAGVRPVRVDQPIYRRHIGVNARTGQARQYGDVILRLLRDKYPTVMR